MAKTGAERQSAWRERQREHLASLKAEAGHLRVSAASLEAENQRLRRTVDTLSAALEAEQPGSGAPSCPHPSDQVRDGRCACGDWVNEG